MNSTDYEPLKVYLGRVASEPDFFRRRSQSDMLWRPTAVVLVKCGGQYLVTNHQVRRVSDDGVIKWKTKPDLPKGGVDSIDLTVAEAAYRELWEEVCLHRADVTLMDYWGHVQVPFDKHNVGRDGYKQGKWYLIYHAIIGDQSMVEPGREHGVVEVLWKEDPASHFMKAEGKSSRKHAILTDPAFDSMFRQQQAA